MVWRHLKYWAWQVFTKGLLGVIYAAVIAEGLRQLVPTLGQKLYRLPGLGALRDYEATYSSKPNEPCSAWSVRSVSPRTRRSTPVLRHAEHLLNLVRGNANHVSDRAASGHEHPVG